MYKTYTPPDREAFVCGFTTSTTRKKRKGKKKKEYGLRLGKVGFSLQKKKEDHLYQHYSLSSGVLFLGERVSLSLSL